MKYSTKANLIAPFAVVAFVSVIIAPMMWHKWKCKNFWKEVGKVSPDDIKRIKVTKGGNEAILPPRIEREFFHLYFEGDLVRKTGIYSDETYGIAIDTQKKTYYGLLRITVDDQMQVRARSSADGGTSFGIKNVSNEIKDEIRKLFQ